MKNLSEKIVKNIPFPVAVLDKHLNYIMVNSRYLKMVSRQENEVVGSNAKDLIPSNLYENAKQYFEKVLNGEQCRFIAEDLELLTVKKMDVTFIPLEDNEGLIAFFAQEEAQKKYFKQGVEAVTVTLNHYINNALTILIGKTKQMKSRSTIDEIEADILKIQEAAGEVTNTLKAISNFEDLKLESYIDGKNEYFKIDNKKEK